LSRLDKDDNDDDNGSKEGSVADNENDGPNEEEGDEDDIDDGGDGSSPRKRGRKAVDIESNQESGANSPMATPRPRGRPPKKVKETPVTPEVEEHISDEDVNDPTDPRGDEKIAADGAILGGMIISSIVAGQMCKVKLTDPLRFELLLLPHYRAAVQSQVIHFTQTSNTFIHALHGLVESSRIP
jgi:hypothetical protein